MGKGLVAKPKISISFNYRSPCDDISQGHGVKHFVADEVLVGTSLKALRLHLFRRLFELRPGSCLIDHLVDEDVAGYENTIS